MSKQDKLLNNQLKDKHVLAAITKLIRAMSKHAGRGWSGAGQRF
jgi:hypothetical protein